jgi:CRP-like cAMP-binding protein
MSNSVVSMSINKNKIMKTQLKPIRNESNITRRSDASTNRNLNDRIAAYKKAHEKKIKDKQLGKMLSGITNMAKLDNPIIGMETEDKMFKWRINPDGIFKKIWETTKFCLLLYTLLYLPTKVAFIDDNNFVLLYWIDKGIDVIFVSDIFLTFFTPVYVKVDMIISLKDIAKNYISGWFFPDVISVMPFEDFMTLIGRKSTSVELLAGLTKAFRLMRLMRLIRLFKAFDFTNADNYFLKFMNTHYKGTIVGLLLPNMMLMTFTIHFFSCCWYLLATLDDTNQNWVVINKFSNKSDFDLYIISFYFVIQTFTTCGYGDIESNMNIELVFRIVAMLAGVFLYGIFSGRIVEYRSNKMADEELLAKKTEALEYIKNQYALTDIMFRSILEKLNEKKPPKRKEYDFRNLTIEDRDSFDYYRLKSKFSKLSLFPKHLLYQRWVLSLGRMLTEKHFKKDQVIFNHNDPPVYFYIIMSGSIRYMMNKLELVPIMEINKGYFGEWELIKNYNREFTAIAKTDCVMFVLEIGQFKKMFLLNSHEDSLCEQFHLMAEKRNKILHKAQRDFEFFFRRKIFWRMALRGKTKKRKGKIEKLFGQAISKSKCLSWLCCKKRNKE